MSRPASASEVSFQLTAGAGPGHVVLDGPEFGSLQVLVVGDVHGCLDELQDLLHSVSFEENSDRWVLVSVGDLVNKGPKSAEVVKYMRGLRNAFCVQGNHELKIFSGLANGQVYPGFDSEDIDYLQALPISITIPSYNCIIVHAGLIPGLKLTDHDPFDILTMRNIETLEGGRLKPHDSPKVGEHWAVLWSKYVEDSLRVRGTASAESASATVESEVSESSGITTSMRKISLSAPTAAGESTLDLPICKVIYGHDAKRGLVDMPHSIGLDTGCVYGRKFTGYLLHTRQLVAVKARKAYAKK